MEAVQPIVRASDAPDSSGQWAVAPSQPGVPPPRPPHPGVPPPRPPQLSGPGIEINDPETLDPALMIDDAESVAETLPSPESQSPESLPSSEIPASLAWDDDEVEADDDDEDDKYVGQTISDRYVVDAVLGEGGMGKVYLAHHKIIGKKVAIKILHAELARDKESVGRFVREARAASSIGNPHIVDIQDFGELDDGSTYFVMEYLDGADLGDLIDDKGALAHATVCDIGLQVCDGLAAAHKQHIVHRDLKPDNIALVEQGQSKHFCKILDFGIAKVSSSSSSTKLTMAGAVFGTPHYMSPEQAAGAAVDHRTDIYSLGVILYEMAAGELPFNADNFMGILTQHMYKAPVPIRALVGAPDVPPGLEAIILKALSKKPEARYQTMDELAEDLRTLKSGGIPKAVHDMMERSGAFNVPADYFKNPTMTPRGPRGKRPTRWGPRLVGFAGVSVAIGLTVFVLIKNSTTTAAPPAPTVAPATTTQLEPKKNEVLLGSDPVGATAVIGDEAHPLPTLIPIEEGQTVAAVVSAEGYLDKEVVLDGAERRVVVTLEAIPKPEPSVSASAEVKPPPRFLRPPPFLRKPKPKPKAKPGDVVDPWPTQ